MNHPREARLCDWLALAELPRIGPVRWQQLLEHYPSPLALLDQPLHGLTLPGPAQEALQAWRSGQSAHPFCQHIRQLWQKVQSARLQLLLWDDADYPLGLRQIHGPPLVLYLRGQRQVLQQPQIALVGSRQASRDGLAHARQFAAALSERGYCITSGLALGIDGAAHQGALAAGGSTLAVLGNGLDQIYPSQHTALAGQVEASGLLLSEMPPGTQLRAGHFPRRNRLISGLAQGVLIVEATLNSGSLITARHALEQGREVFAIPGSIHNPLARGCHRLIREGAKLVETVDDVLEELLPLQARAGQTASQPTPAKTPEKVIPPTTPTLQSWPEDLSADERLLVPLLGRDTQNSDELCQRTGLPADRLLGALLMLEMQGLAETVPGGYRGVSGR